MNNLTRQNQHKGQTLLELSVMLAVLSVVTTISVPWIPPLYEQLKMRSVRDLLSTLVEDQITLAQMYGHTIELSLTNDSLNIWLQGIGSPALRKRSLTKDIALTFPNHSLKAFPNGTISPSTILLEGTYLRCTVTISLRGRVRDACTVIK